MNEEERPVTLADVRFLADLLHITFTDNGATFDLDTSPGGAQLHGTYDGRLGVGSAYGDLCRFQNGRAFLDRP